MLKDKRTQLLALVVATVVGVFSIWFLVIGAEQEGLKTKLSKINEVQIGIQNARQSRQLAEKLRDDLEISTFRLQSVEETMAHGDLYRWVINSLRPLQQLHGVEVTDFSPPALVELQDLPRVSYKGVSFAIRGTARYHALGLFLADLETKMPFVCVRKVEMSANASPTVDIGAREALTFRVVFETLVRPEEPVPSL